MGVLDQALRDRLNGAFDGRYRLDRELGRGGMGLVLLAEDLKHGRQVAIKVLRPDVTAALATERFLSEIQLAARLQHPGIVPVYDSGDADGTLYFVMPFVEGESLRQRLRRERVLPIDEAIRLARDLADALGYAHARGIVHRDIKPENVLLTGGRAVVVDFGIAGAMQAAGGSGLTETGVAIGTPHYMAPEQMTGAAGVDGRADVYALASVVYEMLAGEPPYPAPSVHAIIARRIADPVPRVGQLRERVPVALEQALVKGLAKAPADRFDSAAAFADALTRPGAVDARARSVAVLPFLNLSAEAENEYFADGMTEDVIAQLSKIKGVKVIARSSVLPFKKREQSARDLAARLGVATVLDGSVRRAGQRVRIVAHLIDAETESQVWTETYDRDLTDIFAIQSDVALRIATALHVEISGDERSRVAKKPTHDLEAYQRYLQGKHCVLRYNTQGLRKGLEYLDEAVARDSGFALAYAGIAHANVILAMGFGAIELPPEQAYQRAREAIARALALDPDLGEAHGMQAFLKFVAEFDWAGAERAFARALELNASSFVWDAYGLMLSALGRYDEALTAQRHAQELDPLAPVHASDIATTLIRAGRYDEAHDEAVRLVNLAPDFPMGHSALGWAALKRGRTEEGLAALEQAAALAPRETMLLAQLGQAYGEAGRVSDAHRMLDRLHDIAQARRVSPYHMAYIYTGLGDDERAFDHLEQAYAQRAGGIYGLKGSFLFTRLHAHPRFKALLQKMNLA